MGHKIGRRDRLGKPNCRLCKGDGFCPDTPEKRMINGVMRDFPRVRVCDCRGGSATPPVVSEGMQTDAQSRAAGERDS